MKADHQKRYSEDDFVRFMRKAAELPSESASSTSTRGLSLLEMKSIASEVGLDPDLIERAAHLAPDMLEPTLLGRLLGGPLSSRIDVRLPIN